MQSSPDEQGAAQLRAPAAEEIFFFFFFLFSGEGVLPTSGAGERPSGGRMRAAAGQPQEPVHLGLPLLFLHLLSLAPRLPAVSWVGVGASADPAARTCEGGCRPCSLPEPLHCPPLSPAPHLGAKLAAPAFTLRASLKLRSTPHPPRCSDLANGARRCRSGSPPTGVSSQLNPFPLAVDSSPGPKLPSLRDSQG